MSRKPRNPLLDKRDWLFYQYWIEGLSHPQIANIIGCSNGTVWKAFKRLNIPRRTISESVKGEKHYNYGKKHAGKTIEKMSEEKKGENNPFWGKHHTKKTRKKISEAEKGEKHWNYGKHPTEVTRQKIREHHANVKGECNPMYGKKHTEDVKRKLSELRKKIKIPRHGTQIEIILRKIVEKHCNTIKYTGDGSFWIKTPEMNINPDFIVVGKKIAVEANGEYWHSRLHNPKLRKGADPNERRKFLKKAGWKMIVFWGEDLLRQDAEQFVLSALKKEGIIK